MSNAVCKQVGQSSVPRMITISKIVDEGVGQKSYFFKEHLECKPGQFVMVWLPGTDQKPMAVSYHSKTEWAFTAQKIGPFTTALEDLSVGDQLGITAPLGNSFSLQKNACVVGGGVGMASVSTLIDALDKPVVINGARSKDHLIYLKRFAKENMLSATDDGSHGHKGYTTELLEQELQKGKIKIVYTCGPEIMIKKVFDLCEKYKVTCEAALERYMSCGLGICGKCMVDDQIVCLDGPIFSSPKLRKLTEFGVFARKKSGKKVSLSEYHGVH